MCSGHWPCSGSSLRARFLGLSLRVVVRTACLLQAPWQVDRFGFHQGTRVCPPLATVEAGLGTWCASRTLHSGLWHGPSVGLLGHRVAPRWPSEEPPLFSTAATPHLSHPVHSASSAQGSRLRVLATFSCFVHSGHPVGEVGPHVVLFVFPGDLGAELLRMCLSVASVSEEGPLCPWPCSVELLVSC